MENFSNRIGHDNFVWWIGVVEDNRDPLFLGRCRVRIFGTHDSNLDLIPTDSLPWATPLVPITNPISSASPANGEYVTGFFMDGLSSQAPVMVGVMPGIPQEDPQTGVGFSALSGDYNSQKDPDYVFEIIGKRPKAPTDKAPAMQIQKIGVPTTPTNSWTVANTVVGWTNSNLVHACDFRFLINFSDLNIGVIENPITLIEEAIKDSKNKAAAIIRVLLSRLLDTFRVTFKGIIVALNLDPTGQISQIVSQARDVVRQINAISRKIAEYIGSAALMVSLVQELRQIVDWIQTLPAKVLAMLKDCLTTFSSAITTATSQIQAIPGQVSSSLASTFQQLEKSADITLKVAQAAEAAANVPNTLIQIVTSPTTANVDSLTVYIDSAYPNTNVVISQTNSASFNIANTSTP